MSGLSCLGVGTPSVANSLRIRVDLSNMAGEGVEQWTPILGVYELELDWASEEHSGECSVSIVDHPALATLHPFNRIRLVDRTRSPELVFFIGRINTIKPLFKGALASKGNRGYAWHLYIRDYMQALVDNFVQPDEMHATYAFRPAITATYVPIYQEGASEETPPGQEPSPALTIIRDLITRTGIIPDVTPTLTALSALATINLKRNYTGTSQQSVFQAVYEMASEHPWSLGTPPSGIGYVFRMAPPGQMGNGAVFQLFQRGAVEWDVTQVFGFQGVGSPARIPIQTFTALQEGRAVYSRSRVAGRGLSSYTAPSVSVDSMESTWNPDAGLFRVTRETASQDEILTQLNELQNRAARGVINPENRTYRGEKIGSITVVGMPTNANRVAPVAGDVITLDPPPPGLENPEDNNKYVISSWHFEWPTGFSTYQLNRRPKARSVGFWQDLMRRGLMLLSSLKDKYDSGWLDFSTIQGTGIVPADGKFKHQLGVIPRLIYVCAGDTTDVTEAIADGNADGPPSLTLVERARYDPIQNLYMGYEITAVTKNHVQLSFYPLLAYSAGAADASCINCASDGWLMKFKNTSIRVYAVP